MTWTRRKTTDLLRLLKEYNRTLEKRSGEPKTGNDISTAIDFIEFIENAFDGDRDELILTHLAWWCERVEARYGMKRHTAIKWLVQKYYDGENIKLFRNRFGSGSVDSIARRLGLKAKHQGDSCPAKRREEYAALLKEDTGAAADIYQLTFKILKLWKEPGSM